MRVLSRHYSGEPSINHVLVCRNCDDDGPQSAGTYYPTRD
jgi:hypothetical protein